MNQLEKALEEADKANKHDLVNHLMVLATLEKRGAHIVVDKRFEGRDMTVLVSPEAFRQLRGNDERSEQ